MDTTDLKNSIEPQMVCRRYLGMPLKSDRLGDWYYSPFRSEKTASFLVNNDKGIHDFGTSKHYDIVSFVQEWMNLDFWSAVNKLSYDFRFRPKYLNYTSANRIQK